MTGVRRIPDLVQVQRIYLVFGDLVLVETLDHEGDHVSRVLGLQRDGFVVGGAPEAIIIFL